MSATSHAPGQLFPSPHMFQKSMAPVAVYPPPGPDFDFNYGMVEHTPPVSLFATGPSGSSARDDNEGEDDVEADEEEKRMKTTLKLFEEILEETVVHHVVGPEDIRDISWI
ncbi:hypothetical protein V6N13_003397 [Hibiscus sabdariffa]